MADAYDAIYLNQSRVPGQVRLSEQGLGWKASEKPQGGSAARASEPFLLYANDMQTAQWSRGARAWMLRFQTRSGPVQLDGFESEDFSPLKTALAKNFDLTLEPREHSLRGWNWGKVDFERNELVFNVASRPSFEVPYKSVSNSNTVGKSDVAIEMDLDKPGDRPAGGDELVEMHFYVPGTAPADGADENGEPKKEENGDVKVKPEDGDEDMKDADGDEDAADGESEISAAALFNEQLQKRADIGIASGAELVAFEDILFLTPRGRYDIDMYEETFRLRGKTYDYKVNYSIIQRIFVLPKLDEIHNVVMLQLDPPLRQGQTRYPFVVMEFLREEEQLEVELNIDEAEFAAKFAGRLDKKYEEVAFQVVASLFKGLSNRKITFTGSFVSSHSQPAVSCSLKAAQGALYPLEKAMLFLSKSPVYIPYTEVANVRFSRVGTSVSTSRTFDMTVSLRAGAGEHHFLNIDREEQNPLDVFFQSKNIKTVNDVSEEQKMLDAALAGEGSDDDDADAPVGGSEDEGSEDEDFNASEESDPAEEFDSDAESASGEDDDDEPVSGDELPPAKKSKRE